MSELLLTPAERTRCRAVMKRHSVTYYNATRFFPRKWQDAVYVLYRWVREADELVDNPDGNPQQAIQQFRQEFEQAWQGEEASADETHRLFVRLMRMKRFEQAWIKSFLDSMELDLTKKVYNNRDELKSYIYGSADVVGLMMARILGVADHALPAAQALGHWMQLVNFLRDVGEDWNQRQRVYLPQEFLAEYDIVLTNTKRAFSDADWKRMVRDWVRDLGPVKQQALSGMPHLPRWSQLPIYVSIVLYQWTLDRIEQAPLRVWDESMKPGRDDILKELPSAVLAFVRREYR